MKIAIAFTKAQRENMKVEKKRETSILKEIMFKNKDTKRILERITLPKAKFRVEMQKTVSLCPAHCHCLATLVI